MSQLKTVGVNNTHQFMKNKFCNL